MAGASLIAQYFHNLFYLVPDLAGTIFKTQITTNSVTNESKIVSEFQYIGSKIYDISISDIIPKKKIQDKNTNNSITNSTQEVHISNSNSVALAKKKRKWSTKRLVNQSILSSIHESEEVFENTIDSVDISKLILDPVQARNSGNLILHLNKDKSIYSMQIFIKETEITQWPPEKKHLK